MVAGRIFVKTKQKTMTSPAFIALKRTHGLDKPSIDIITPHTKDVKLFWSMWEPVSARRGHTISFYRGPAGPTTICSATPSQDSGSHNISTVMPVAGHFGVYRTTAAAVRHFYWPRMQADVHRYIKTCLRCEMSKTGPRRHKAPLCQEILRSPQ